MKNLYGFYKGVVVNNSDSTGNSRLILNIPQVFPSTDGGITYPATGWCPPSVASDVPPSIPATGSVVWVSFEAGDSDHPVWLGTTVVPPATQSFSFRTGVTSSGQGISFSKLAVPNTLIDWVGLPPVSFIKSRADTRLLIDVRVSSYVTGVVGLVQLGIRQGSTHYDIVGGHYFNQTGVHMHYTGVVTILPAAIPQGLLSFQLQFISPVALTLVWDSNDFITIIITETN